MKSIPSTFGSLLGLTQSACLLGSVLFSLLWSCSTPPEQQYGSAKADSSLSLAYARGFSVDYYDSQQILSLISTSDTSRYYLLPANQSVPPELEGKQLIRTPVRRVVTLSTTHLAYLKMLGQADVVVGLEKAAYVYDSTIINRVGSGQIQEVSSGNTLNTERVLSLQPDLILISHMPGGDLSAYQKFINLGVPVLPVAEWTESTPLGKAEWLKFFAALVQQGERANIEFNRTKQAYNDLVQLTQSVDKHPSVIVGTPFQGTWYVPGAQSYRNALLQDAGANWAFSRDSTAVSFPVDLEIMYDLGLKAEVWLDPGQPTSTQEILGIDARFADFSSYQSGKIYNSNRRLNSLGGGNDYYESGVVYPERILADLIRILQPELLPQHQLYYYQKLP